MGDTLTPEWFFTGSLYGIHRKQYLELPNGDVIPAEFHWERLSNVDLRGSRSCGIYTIDTGDRQRVYAGSSCDISRRLWSHNNDFSRGRHKNTELLGSYRSHSETIVRFATFDRFNDFRYVEQALLDYGFVDGRLFNRQPLATSPRGMKHTQETLDLMSESAKRRNISPEVWLDTRRRISEKLKGVPLSDERRAQQAASNSSRWEDDEFRKRWEEKAKRAVSIDGVVYDSLTSAGQALGVTPSRVRSRIVSPNSKFAGWSYVTEVSTRKQSLPRG